MCWISGIIGFAIGSMSVGIIWFRDVIITRRKIREMNLEELINFYKKRKYM